MIFFLIILCLLVAVDIALHLSVRRKKRLSDLCNMSNGLLLRLAQEAPGTFQHSLQVASLVVEAGKRTRANVLLLVAGALYHDVGKLWNPSMYTENQKDGINPHDNLSTQESVEIIKRHVTEGELLADKEQLPAEIKAFISTHHGHGTIKYFLNTWVNNHPGEKPDIDLFTYQGKDPITMEQAILMMADGIEAASRSLPEYTHESISNLVENIFDNLIHSGRLNHARIAIRDVQRCKEAFKFSLETIYHSRIKYPEIKNTGVKK